MTNAKPRLRAFLLSFLATATLTVSVLVSNDAFSQQGAPPKPSWCGQYGWTCSDWNFDGCLTCDGSFGGPTCEYTDYMGGWGNTKCRERVFRYYGSFQSRECFSWGGRCSADGGNDGGGGGGSDPHNPVEGDCYCDGFIVPCGSFCSGGS